MKTTYSVKLGNKVIGVYGDMFSANLAARKVSGAIVTLSF